MMPLDKEKRRPGDPEATFHTTEPVDTAEVIRCKECSKPLTAPKTIRRRMCRSCWRVHKVLGGAA